MKTISDLKANALRADVLMKPHWQESHSLVLMLKLNCYRYFFSAGEDYDEVYVTLSFTPNSMEGAMECSPIDITPDFAYEKTENFSLHVISERNVLFDIQWAEVCIDNDDGKKSISQAIEV